MRTTGKATDLITFSRSSGGTALRKIAYGPELVTNGTFDTDTDWTKGTGWTISSGTATHSGGVYGALTQDLNTTAGSVFILTADITYISGGGIQLHVNGVGPSAYTSTQSISYVFVAAGTNNISFGAGTGNWTIDNVSVKEVLFDQGDLTLFNHPADIPRIEYDANGNVLGLLVEESRTNLVTYSEDFSASFWSTIGASISSNVAVSPDGATSADKLVENDQNSNHQVNWGLASIELATGAPLSFSIFAKAGERDKLAFRWGLWVFCTFDLSDGSVTPLNNATYVVTNAATVDCGSGWYRCQFTITNTGATTLAQSSWRILDAGGNQSYLGDGASGLYIWGAQLEVGAFPTSYIPTSGSTATRAADVASIATSEFGYRDDEGTVVVEGSSISGESGERYASLSDGTANNQVWIQANGSGTFVGNVYTGGAYQARLDNTSLSSSSIKSALAIKTNDFAIASKGESPIADASGSIAEYTQLHIGRRHDGLGASLLNGHIKKLTYIPRRLTNDQLQEITS